MPRIQLKLIGALAGLVAAVVLVSGYAAETALRERELDRIEGSLERDARLVREMVGETPLLREQSGGLTRLATRASEAFGARVTLIASDGTVVADSEVTERDLARIDNHRLRPEVRRALEGAVGVGVRESATVGRELMYLAVPVGPAGSHGAVRIAVDLSAVDGAVSALRRELIGAGSIGLGLAVALSFLLSWVFVRPLSELRQVVTGIGAGDLTRRIRRLPRDELGEIARAINRTAEELATRVGTARGEKEQLEAVLQGMVEGVLVVSGDDRIVLANRRLRELFGVAEDVVGKLPLEAIRDARIHDAIREARDAGRPVKIEIRLATPQPRILEVNAVAVPSSAVRPGVVAVLHDVSEVRRLDAVRRDFVANASHELRTPLTAIRGFAETMLGSPELAESVRGHVEVLLRHAERLGRLIEDLLQLSRIEGGALDLELGAVELGRAVEGVIRDLEPELRSRSLEAVVVGEGIPPVRADRRAVEHVLANLMDNAVKYSEPGGRVEVRLSTEGDRVRTEVVDTGIGIPDDDLGRIFERFYRVDKGRSRELGGTGLGLAIVKHLLHLIDGEVTVRSTLGRGSAFAFTLPVWRRAAPPDPG